MAIQQDISATLNQAKVGQVMKVIIDREESEFYVGRTEFDSPEVDPEVLITKPEKKLQIGDFCMVEVTSAEDYDLFGRVL
jgi:ribosomal protein S12 methylthiotransferase